MQIILNTPQAVVIYGDSIEAMQWAREVNVSCSDPPYTAHVQNNIRSVDCSGSRVKVKSWGVDFPPLAGYEHWKAQLAITKRWCLNFCALEQLGEYCEASGGFRKEGGLYVRSWIWRKGQAAPQISGNCPANSCEGIAIGHAKGVSMRWNGRGKHAWWDGAIGVPFNEDFADNVVFSNRDRNEKRHPNQKPQQLCDDLILKFTEPNDLVGDWYTGSGAIASSCIRSGRRVIAVDSDPLWALYTAKRCLALLHGDMSYETKVLKS